MDKREMLPIPVAAARRIAEEFGYDQVIVIARRVGEAPAPFGEHVATYGRDKDNCGVAARVGQYLKHKVMGWPEYEPAAPKIGFVNGRFPPAAFEQWFAEIEAGDGTIPVPQSVADGNAWHEHIGRRQIALGAWLAATEAALTNQEPQPQ